MGLADTFGDWFGSKAELPPKRTLGQDIGDVVANYPQMFDLKEKYDPLEAARASRISRQSSMDALGLYEDMTPRMSGLTASANTAARSADIGDVESLGPRNLAALKAANPELARLLDTMTGQAQSDLESPTPEWLLRDSTQSTLGRQAYAGGGHSVRDFAGEVLGRGRAAEDFKTQRFGRAANVAGLNREAYGDPFQSIVGRSSGAVPATMGIRGAGGSSDATFNDLFGRAGAINDLNYNAGYSANLSNAKMGNDIFGGLAAAGGKLFGSLGEAAIKKWV